MFMPFVINRAAGHSVLLWHCLAGLPLLLLLGAGGGAAAAGRHELRLEDAQLPRDDAAPAPAEGAGGAAGGGAGGAPGAGRAAEVASPDAASTSASAEAEARGGGSEALQARAIAEHVREQLENGSTGEAGERLHVAASPCGFLESLLADPELESVFADLRANGPEAVLKYLEDEELMLKVSRKAGGLPPELRARLAAIDDAAPAAAAPAAAASLHEAVKSGDLGAVEASLARGPQPALEARDGRGVTPLGYAIGLNHLDVVKLLLERRADPISVDAAGNSGLHYAAGYGHKELAELLLRRGAAGPALRNDRGQTPLAVATVNRHSEVLELLKARMTPEDAEL